MFAHYALSAFWFLSLSIQPARLKLDGQISAFPTLLAENSLPTPRRLVLRRRFMAAAGWLRRAVVAASLPRLPSGLPLMQAPPPVPLPEAQSLVLPGLGAATGAAMELMAVPKKKVSKYKKGLRNGPKALKPVPVIVRCRCCGRVKLPHFYCCSGERGNPGDSSS